MAWSWWDKSVGCGAEEAEHAVCGHRGKGVEDEMGRRW